ncbi:tRNA pseudouridine(38-40) synthase TruA [Rhabdobacter roseus]|uniref:tRNA pseudouridine synthase A n=1 Tax=Rhabdobacter roseus TaxID=1655419 RepID=A0A840TX83_9BACT|nr:tRNA pseudouridine(38-40) synthase TruA [Rhabdobacter roseus]MBB5285873.1 tRNA pseudouridine38-40 synthase [Rhabdobacter roseus]
MRYFIECSYQGTRYNGWQKQPNALAVQQVLEEVMQKVLRQPIELVGSSRTDTGVHAEQQFAHFDLPGPLPEVGKVVNSLNGLLPHDIAVRQLLQVPPDLHSRFAATHRCYEYRIIRHKSPFQYQQAYLFRPALDVVAMNEAAALLLRYDDFESFSKIHTDVKTFRCAINEAQWVLHGEALVFRVRANRFLRGMVRALVGTLLEVGLEKRTVADFEQVILAKNRKQAGAQAPAHGLFLTEVGYPAELFS